MIMCNVKGYDIMLDDIDEPILKKYDWSIQKLPDGTRRVIRCECNNGMKKSVYMSRQIMQAQHDQVVIFIDKCSLNMTRGNMVLVSNVEYQKYRKPPQTYRGELTGVKGVRRTASGKYKAVIRTNQRTISLGIYAQPERAKRAYDMAAERLHGHLAYTNEMHERRTSK